MTATPINLEKNGKLASCSCTSCCDIQLFPSSVLFKTLPLGKTLEKTRTIQLITQRHSIVVLCKDAACVCNVPCRSSLSPALGNATFSRDEQEQDR